ILRRDHGLQIDHLGLCVPDTQAGIAEIEKRTGARVFIDDPEPGQWYWSGVIPIAADSYLEIVGPNPHFHAKHPMRTLTEQLSGPTVFFWYIATDDIEGLAQQAKQAGAVIENIEWVNTDDAHPEHSRYGRAFLGPGFVPQKPCVIQWDRHVLRKGVEGATPECEIVSLDLSHPTADAANQAMEKMGIDARLNPGPSRFRLEIACPKGNVVFDNPGWN
ncbi:MAG: VOC family protein, partial [Candidatus Phaeomarinobacter sp.]